MARARSANRGLALRWPVPVAALAAGCGLAVLVYQAGAVPVPAGHDAHPVLGRAPVHGTSTPDGPQRSAPLRPVEVTQQLVAAVQLAPAVATTGLHLSAPGAHVAAVSHHAPVLTGSRHTAPASLAVTVDPPASGTDPGTTAPSPSDPTVPTDPASTLPDQGMVTVTLQDQVTLTVTLPEPGTVTPPDPGTITPPDLGTLTPSDPGTTTDAATDPATDTTRPPAG